MHHLPQLLLLALYVLRTSATANLAQPAHIAARQDSGELTICAPPSHPPGQMSLNPCPEHVNAPIYACSLCGGESSSVPGHCQCPNDWGAVCRCENKGTDDVITTLVTTTASGETATGTYELATLTEYADLRQHITVTTTATATSTATGDTGVETVAVVVLAGGVAWLLADAAGGAAAISALEPPDNAQDHEDDETCPDPENKCSECEGNNQMCTSGTDSGCACEDSTCPTSDSDDQPSCSDEGCDAEDGKCSGGDYEGCDCSEDECPDLDEFPFLCSQCGDRDANGKCKGLADHNDLWKGCDCYENPDWAGAPPGLVRNDYQANVEFLNNLPDLVSGDPTTDPLPDAKCDTNKTSRLLTGVFDPDVYAKFCADVGEDRDQALKRTVDSKGEEIAEDDDDDSDNVEVTLDWTGGDGSCPSNCTEVFSSIANGTCGSLGTGQGQVRVMGVVDHIDFMATEAELDTGCGVYSYSISEPPPTPTTASTSTNTDPTTTVQFSAPVRITPTRGPVHCAEYFDSYKDCWHDVKKGLMEDCADAFYGDTGTKLWKSDHRNVTQRLRKGGEGGSGVKYMMNIGWIPGCDTFSTMNASWPLGGDADNYQEIIKSTYYNCRDNNGLGGYIDVGCLRYGFYPNNVKGAESDQQKFWAVYPDICG